MSDQRTVAGQISQLADLATRIKSAGGVNLFKGADGTNATIAIRSIATGASGTGAIIVNAGTASNALYDITIPRGDSGAAATFVMGTVAALPPGSTPTASITGTAPNYTLNLGLVTGASGSGTGDMLRSDNLSGLANYSTARSNLGLGALATKSTVNDGDWNGLDLSIANGGSGASTASAALANFGGFPASSAGTAATKNTGTSGNTVPLLDGANTWANAQAFSGTVTINGDLNVNGTTTTIDASQLNVADPIISVARNNSTGAVTYSGLRSVRGSAGNAAYLLWDEANDVYVVQTAADDAQSTPVQVPFKASQLISTVATGTAPFAVTSTTPVPSLSIGGNAASATLAAAATKLQTARNINGVPFDGTAAITVADATKQPLDQDLTDLAAITATGVVLVRTTSGVYPATLSGLTLGGTATAPVLTAAGTSLVGTVYPWSTVYNGNVSKASYYWYNFTGSSRTIDFFAAGCTTVNYGRSTNGSANGVPNISSEGTFSGGSTKTLTVAAGTVIMLDTTDSQFLYGTTKIVS